MTLRSMAVEHDCVYEAEPDCDLCSGCGDHTGFCEECGLSECCGAGSYDTDYTIERD
jgi:hypothetical protein